MNELTETAKELERPELIHAIARYETRLHELYAEIESVTQMRDQAVEAMRGSKRKGNFLSVVA